MVHPAIIAAVNAGLLEPCVILDGNGLELCGYRPTEFGRRYFGPEINQSEVAAASTNRPSTEGRYERAAVTRSRRGGS
jgi:hypothetical protein